MKQRQHHLDATAVHTDEFAELDDLDCAPGRYDYLADQEDGFTRLSMKNERSPRRMREHY
jgi:hypothetical protein